MSGLLPKVEGLERRLKEAARGFFESEGVEARLTWGALGSQIEVVSPYTGRVQACDAHWLRELAGRIKRECAWTKRAHTGIALWQLEEWGRWGRWREERRVGGQLHAYDPAREAPPAARPTASEVGLGLPGLGQFVALDVESTGTRHDDEVIEVALVAFSAGRIVHRWCRRVLPSRPISPGAARVHGISMADLAGCPPFAALAPFVARYVERAGVVVGHNLAFDRRLLEQSGLAWPEGATEVCTDRLARSLRTIGLVASRRTTLDALCEEVGVPLEGHHAAAADAEACGRLLLALVARYGEGAAQAALGGVP